MDSKDHALRLKLATHFKPHGIDATKIINDLGLTEAALLMTHDIITERMIKRYPLGPHEAPF